MEDYSDLIDLSFTIVCLIAYYQCDMIYLTIHILNKKDIMKVLEYFDNMIVDNQDYLISEIRKKHYLKNTRKALIFAKIILIGITASGVIIAVFDIYRSKVHAPLFFHFPGIPLDSIFFYPCNIILQVILYFAALEIIMWSDAFIMITIMYCDAELRSIAELISYLDNEEVVKEKTPKILRTIHEAHLAISEKAQQLIKSFWHIYFHKLFTITLYLCFMLFIFQSIDASVIVPAVACNVVILQTFILCYFGQIIRNSSEDMSRALFMTKWYEMDVKDQKNLLMLMIRFHHLIKVETFGFGEISIYTFVQIFKASVSYATIFYTVFQ